MIKSIDHIVLTAQDTDKTIQFYCGVLGMTLDRFTLLVAALNVWLYVLVVRKSIYIRRFTLYAACTKPNQRRS